MAFSILKMEDEIKWESTDSVVLYPCIHIQEHQQLYKSPKANKKKTNSYFCSICMHTE